MSKSRPRSVWIEEVIRVFRDLGGLGFGERNEGGGERDWEKEREVMAGEMGKVGFVFGVYRIRDFYILLLMY